MHFVCQNMTADFLNLSHKSIFKFIFLRNFSRNLKCDLWNGVEKKIIISGSYPLWSWASQMVVLWPHCAIITISSGKWLESSIRFGIAKSFVNCRKSRCKMHGLANIFESDTKITFRMDRLKMFPMQCNKNKALCFVIQQCIALPAIFGRGRKKSKVA